MTMRKTTLEFLLYDVLNAQDLTSRSHYAMHSRETFDAMFEVAQEIATKELKPHHRKSDLEEPHVVNGRVVTIPEIKRALGIMAEAGFFAATAPESHGGLQLPEVIYTATHAVFSASNAPTTSYMFLTVGAGNLIRSFGTPEQQARYLTPMLEGRWFGTMALSEPHAGSSLAEILTRATPLDDGSFRIAGSKMWISGGDHELSENIVHMVLAKLPDAPPGVKGISLFIVPKKRITTRADGSHGLEMNDVALAGLNHKLGARGTTNALLSFGEGNDCRGELVGEPHKGLAYMFQMMNEARISVGLGAASLAQAGFEYSLNYARERRQGRSLSPNQGAGSSPVNPNEPVRIIEHSDVKRMLLAQKSLAQGSLALCLYASKLVDDERTHPDEKTRAETHALLELLTPIVKAWSSHYGLEANYNAIQVLGGYGYTREYDAEMLYRDNRINPIHEGTNGIQSLDLLGRKAAQENGLGLKLLAARMLETTARARNNGLESHAESLEQALEVCENTTRTLLAAGNPETMLANSWHYLEMLGHTVIAWLWLEQAVATKSGSRSAAFVSGILATCQYFYRFELPKVATWGALLSSLDTTTVTVQDDWF
jgi:alkylation response protein AidB-like acyl-CoA dehydrogenase